MSLAVISFTKKGTELSKRLAGKWDGEEILLFTKCSDREDGGEDTVCFTSQSVSSWAGEQMGAGNSLLFIGACGIAVRAVAPHITDKLHDSPVLVMDERGAYVIPILSGHMGGANELAVRLSEWTGAVPVITTATDINGKFAVDLFAKRNGLHIENKEGIARVSARALAGEKLTFSVETGHFGEEKGIPAGLCLVPYPPRQPVDIVITSEKRQLDAAIFLRPREYALGMGCKRGKEAEKIETLISRSLEEAGISVTQLLALASVEQKRDEEGLLSWSRKERVPFITYTAAELQAVEGKFCGSCFVKEKVGVDNVCERAALKACGPDGRLVRKKHAEDGMTIAIAKREWRVTFDEK